MKRDQGFVLVNALVLVTAMAAVAVFLLARAESARVHLEHSQTGAQVGYYLDAFDALALTMLDRDGRTNGAVDHLGEDWTKARFDIDVDRGQISGALTDMQGLFNINWLTDASNTRAAAAWSDVLLRAGIGQPVGDAILAFLKPGGPASKQAYARLDPPLDPVGGAILMFEQLHDIPQIGLRDMARLRLHTTALPADAPLNINTAHPDLIAAFLPELSATAVASVIGVRDQAPFGSTEQFVTALEDALGEGLDESFDVARFSVGSDWFQLDSTAQLRNHTAERTSVLFRAPFPFGTTRQWQTTRHP